MDKKRILIVDDEKNIRMNLEKALSEKYEVDSTINGEEALKMLEDQHYPLVLLDLKLPGKDGIEVLKEINEIDYKTKVIIITGFGSVDSAVETLKLGATDYLRKPFKPDEIRNKVEKVLSRYDLEEQDKEPEDFNEMIEMARAKINNKEFEDAEEYLNKALSLDTESPIPFNLLGIIHEMNGEINKAQKKYRAALSLDPSYKPADKNLSRTVGISSDEEE